MKSKATIGIIVSLLLATSGIWALGAKADGSNTSLRVSPGVVNLYPPVLGSNFTANVTAFNVTDLFGYEFKVSWNTVLLDCIAVNVTPPTEWADQYFVAKNETDHTLGQYWLALSAHNVPAFTGNATLAQLTFKVIVEPPPDIPHPGHPPREISSPIHLFDTMLVDKDENLIDHTTNDGICIIHAVRATVQVLPSKTTVYNAKGVTFPVEVWVFNVSNLAHFSFSLSFNSSLLDLASDPEPGSIFPSTTVTPAPFNYSINATLRVAGLTMESPLVPANGNGSLGIVYFTSRMQSVNDSCVFELIHVELKTAAHQSIPFDIVNGEYDYVRHRGEVDNDTKVDVKDVYLVAKAFGSRPGDPNWNPQADLNNDGKIDIRDFVEVCMNFG
jgi:hypothetical protein